MGKVYIQQSGLFWSCGRDQWIDFLERQIEAPQNPEKLDLDGLFQSLQSKPAFIYVTKGDLIQTRYQCYRLDKLLVNTPRNWKIEDFEKQLEAARRFKEYVEKKKKTPKR